MSRNYGYQGFRPSATIVPPSLTPGTTLDSRDHKFANVGTGLVYTKAIPTRSRWGSTVTKEGMRNTVSKDYKVPDRRGVSSDFSSEASERIRPFLGQSMYLSTYTNPAEDLAQVRRYTSSPEPFEKAFYSRTSGGKLDVKILGDVLDEAMGGVAPDWVKGKCTAACHGVRSGCIDWDTFRSKLGQILEAAINEATPVGTNIPEWMVLSAKPVPKIISDVPLKSCYQCDMGGRGEGPQTRSYTYKAGMMSTSQDLFRGTTKDTYHIPGYSGHIPASRRNPVAITQGDAAAPRPSRESIAMNCNNEVAGYTGHVPRNLMNDRGTRLCGCDPQTTSGAAALHMML
mmetsp:Transcript_22713/g.70326  ORF Transcript_22713/g.70326 Transcript_22713/m.70326 type:complete len:342 (-) Transcript_22713:99-1124(-)|eukprot:CAMPEP_0118850230 /NCGR_PEP_ID=MMETSP1163-20130328/185_1 /TAXON_ID=124430 /ORGANISM="Phaeomonas parva, Strain CCMP2877" /LENGTH=341 /DNA_ID=CAMNT_0006782433 /DNA_START=117 /DNA_END=1142 /DNA_ORIENTATION=+